ncbi:MAG: acylneuraminate cytidylyltransferase family protein [Akkermansiaceae bacterium]|nr:acylneuraminate cytidylyltransferase family protein [Akkermansiaceae bacterium]
MEILAIIPARGGSKGLPGKNIRLLAGVPLIAHTIRAALEADTVSRILVSTDDEDIAAVARESGAEVPFLRPPELSDDKAFGVDVCLHALAHAEDVLDYHPEFVILLQPTSPMRHASDINAAVSLLCKSGADSVVSLKPVTEYPQWMKKMDGQQRISSLFDDLELTSSRQDLEKSYLLNGAIYLSTAAALKKNRSFYGGDTRGYVMPEDRSIDIDTLKDFLTAETFIIGTHS